MREDLNPATPSLPPPQQQPLFDLPLLEVAPQGPPKADDSEVAAARESAANLPGKTPGNNSALRSRDIAAPDSPHARPPEPELDDTLGEETLPEPEPAALDHWKAALRHDFEEWLDSLDEIPEVTDATLDAADMPDLYSFHAQLAAGNAETRKANRRTAEAFSQWGETLSKFDDDLRLLREQLARLPAAKEDALPRRWCLALVEILDRAVRLAVAFAAPPRNSWWGRGTGWPKAWATQRQGLDILVSHLQEMLQKAGVTRLSALNQPFDPATMTAVAIEHKAHLPHHTVIEEVAPGYSLQGDLLRVAQVKVSTNKP